MLKRVTAGHTMSKRIPGLKIARPGSPTSMSLHLT
jgi:hypothetical protein